MAAPTGPTVRRMQLGWELKRLREKAGLTLTESTDGLPFSTSKLHRVERALTGLQSAADLRALLTRYGVFDEEDQEFLVEIQRDSLKRGWWSQYRRNMPSGMDLFVGLESGAHTIRGWQPNVVYGLLQTERYSREMLLAAKPVEETTTEFVERTIDLRMDRKKAITRSDNPLELWVILCEAALRRTVGSSDVMLEQYEEIARIAKADNVTVQVLPFDMATYRSSTDFALMEFDRPLPTVVQNDGVGESNVTDRDTIVWAFSRKFDTLRAGALAPSETPNFLSRLSREM
ncbi:helix-turn-helix domain-containing protein [Streptomyces sp. TR02-1]|uniref:helix-turn-helix domain-containing protein n=1 Tax=Streptomyces sp. TR02-1 TaxID=3385977 RepID=UPI0039A2D05A